MREILALLPKPSRYLGIEEGSVYVTSEDLLLKETIHCALAFPDMYEVGMSYLGQKIIYSLLNSMPHVVAERVFTPCRDASKILKEYDVPLATMESDTNLVDTHFLGFSITTELAFTNVLYMLDLAKIPLLQADRGDNLFQYPIIMAGGGCTICSEPLAPFMDIMALGEGEVMMPPLIDLLQLARKEKWTRTKFLEEARHIHGIYVPSLFIEQENGMLSPKFSDYTKVLRGAVSNLEDAHYPISQVVPFGAVHNRLSLEIARGCTRGCRFCQAGMTLRPSRERNIEELHTILKDCLQNTGFDDVSFLSLSCGDFSALKTFFLDAAKNCAQEQVSISLPSLRVGSVDGDIMQALAGIRRTGATLAPEAGSQRLRDVINKGITEEALLHHVRQLVGYGWQQVKLYFMIGLPTESYEDLDAIVELCKKVRDCCRVPNEKGYMEGPRITVTAAFSPFVPKTHTPFQWEAQISFEEMRTRIFYLRDKFKQNKSLVMRWHEPSMSYLEGIISRGDRKLAPLIQKAFENGGIFSTWIEGFSLEPWLLAAKECEIDLDHYTGARDINAPLAWDHLEAGLSKSFLIKERERAFNASLSADCRYSVCRQCGVCDTKAALSLIHPVQDVNSTNTEINIHKAQNINVKTISKSYLNKVSVTPLKTMLNQDSRDQDEFGYIPPPPSQNKTKQAPVIIEELIQKTVRYRIWHNKKGQAAYLSQLEIQALLDRSMRRANLPLAFSQGFHPLPLLTFGMALTVSIQSEAEWFAITLRKPMSAKEVEFALAPHMLRGLEINKVEILPLSGSIQNASFEKFLVSYKQNTKEELITAFKDFNLKEYVEFAKLNKKGVLKTRNIRRVLETWQSIDNEENISKQDKEQYDVSMILSWEDGYISPISFMQQILPEAKSINLDIKKIEQIFI